MELYVEVGFWLGALGLIVRSMFLTCCKYPRAIEKSLGQELAEMVIGALFTAWAFWLVYA